MIVIVDPSSDQRGRIAGLLDGHETVDADDLSAARDALERASGRPRLAIMGPGLEIEDVLTFAGEIERERGGGATLLVAETLDAELLRAALRAGVDDVLTTQADPQEWEEAITRAFERIAEEHDLEDSHSGRGRIVSVFSTKGGCGKSLVASNLAVLVASRLRRRAALVDLDLQSGDLAIMFQLMPALSIFDAAQGADRLDEEALEGYLTRHDSGVSLLAAPLEPSLAEQVEPAAVNRILELLPQMYPVTIVDGPPLFTDQMLVALDASDEIILVGSMDVPSIKNLRLAVNTITQLGHPREQLRIVLNRADTKVGLRAAEVEKSLGVTIDVQIPSSREVPLSINQGSPLAVNKPRSTVVQAIAQLADEIAPPDDQDQRTRRRRR